MTETNANAIYKVGDKAVVVSTEGASMTCPSVGTRVQIIGSTGIDRYEVLYTADDGEEGIRGYISGSNLEKVADKPTKNQRISALEAQITELKAEVEALKQAQGTPTVISNLTVASDVDVVKIAGRLAELVAGETGKPRKKPALTPNELRKAIIAEARAFVEDAKNSEGTITRRRGYSYESTSGICCDVEFVVNAEKRTVVALLKGQMRGGNYAKGIAKCAPGDVFNADIGKAIALGRALGLDASKFEQAVQPTEFAVGQKTKGRRCYFGKVTKVSDGKAYTEIGSHWKADAVQRNAAFITDDTEAQYD